MLTAFNQNWRTTDLGYSLALATTVNTGGSFTTPIGATRNSKIWASAGFRGFGPMMTFTGSGLDNVQGFGQLPLNYLRAGFNGVACGCNCDGSGMGQISTWGPCEWIVLGLAAFAGMLFWRGGR